MNAIDHSYQWRSKNEKESRNYFSIIDHMESFIAESSRMCKGSAHKSTSKVCDELEGMPNHQVSKFQAIAAIKPAKITSSVIKFSLTDLAIVFPILNSPMRYFETKNAAKLKDSCP